MTDIGKDPSADEPGLPPPDSNPPPPIAADKSIDDVEECAEPGKGKSPSLLFTIVGIGASAGGLNAFNRLLYALPVDTGMAFVVVQHLAPAHPSALAEILSRATKMPVLEVQHESSVQPNHIYVIPPGQSMVISQGRLQLQPRPPGAQHRPIDHFFRSLAEDQMYQAIGVVLSGTASDGTLGLEAIKVEGGITFAQDATAQQEGMPHSAIASGSVDFVMPPEDIAREIARIGCHPYAKPKSGVDAPKQEEVDFHRVISLVRDATGVDFSNYKVNTLRRRVTRRVVLQKMSGLAEYVQFLGNTPAEAESLYQDILINLTSFFRDPEAFEALKTSVFPRLLENRGPQEPLRIWTLGCSTGEEAYSLAMAFREFAQLTGSQTTLQLFATDLNAVVIEKARAAVYSKGIAQDVSAERLRQFFVEADDSYQIRKSIRDACVFSPHDVLRDPAFSRIDLISCRNLLIYLQPVLQQRILPILHYALKPNGFLWLGNSETIGRFRHLFEARDVRHKVYAKKPGSTTVRFPLRAGGASRSDSISTSPRPRGDAGLDLSKEADRILLTTFAPPAVLISADLEILQCRGDTGPYLTPAPGKASLHLLKMLREGLIVSVRAAVLRAAQEGARVRETGLRVKSNGGERRVAIEVIPIKGNAHPGGNGFLILFEAADQDHESQSAGVEPGQPGGGRAGDNREWAAQPTHVQKADQDHARLAQELLATREFLQSVIEQQEATNEELQAANEEAQSSNEELQSINEELETSKEEIQSSNEELATINDEMNKRNTELDRLNNDLVNLLGSVEFPIVILGRDLRVRRITRAAEKLLNLVPSDVGRLLGDVKLNFELPDLERLLVEVLDTLSGLDRDVLDRHGRWHSLRLRPYQTQENKIDGVILVLVDVDLLKRAQAYTESIVATVREPLLVLDGDLRVRTASLSFCECFQTTSEKTVGQLVYDIGNRQFDKPDLRRLVEEVLRDDSQFHDFEMECDFEHIGKRTMRLNVRQLIQESDRKPSILLAIEDVTERKNLEVAVQERIKELALADRHKNEFLAILAHELRNPLAPIRNALQILKTPGADPAIAGRAQQMMDRHVGNMTRLIDDLLDVARITEGKFQLRKELTELAPIVTEAVESTQHYFQGRRQELAVSLPPQPVYLDADHTRLVQVVANLLNNASKFGNQSGRVWLRADVTGTEGGPPGAVVVRVGDDGIGIPAEQLPRVFDLFAQVDQSLERSQGGLGIGLTLVKNLVQMHGGSVEVQSAGIGQGSEFIVRLPYVSDTRQIRQTESVGSQVATAIRRRILVVDDNRDAAESLALLLEDSGHDVHVAHDGLEGVESATALRPDVIILDIGLPKLNGYEAAQRIREFVWGKNVVLVALTGWGQEEDRRKSTEAGFNFHLVKPVDYSDIRRLLENLGSPNR